MSSGKEIKILNRVAKYKPGSKTRDKERVLGNIETQHTKNYDFDRRGKTNESDRYNREYKQNETIEHQITTLKSESVGKYKKQKQTNVIEKKNAKHTQCTI